MLTFRRRVMFADPPVVGIMNENISKIYDGTPVYFYPSILHRTCVKMSDELPNNLVARQGNKKARASECQETDERYVVVMT